MITLRENKMGAHTAAVSRDAKDRSWRTFLQGLMIDVSVAAVLILATAVSSLEWTRTFWVALGLSLARTVVQTCVAYAMRWAVPPNTPPS